MTKNLSKLVLPTIQERAAHRIQRLAYRQILKRKQTAAAKRKLAKLHKDRWSERKCLYPIPKRLTQLFIAQGGSIEQLQHSLSELSSFLASGNYPAAAKQLQKVNKLIPGMADEIMLVALLNNEITLDQFGSLKYLIDVMTLCPTGAVKAFHWNASNAPWQVAKDVYYKDKEACSSKFQAALNTAPKAEQQYFTVEFTPELMLAYLKNLRNRKLNKRQEQLVHQLAEKTKLIFLTTKTALNELINKIERDNPELAHKPTPKQITDGVNFLLQFESLEQSFPSTCVSTEPTLAMPKLCFIVPTMVSYKALLTSLFGSEAVLPHFFVGSIPTRLIRYLSEHPEGPLATLYKNKLNDGSNGRPVELIMETVSDVFTKNPHGYGDTPKSLLTAHDLWHCFVASSLRKRTLRRLNRKLARAGACAPKGKTEHGFQMSLPMWKFVDQDIRAGRDHREDPEGLSKSEYSDQGFLLQLVSVNAFLRNSGEIRPISKQGKPTALLLIILEDFVNHYDEWREDFHFQDRTFYEFSRKLVSAFMSAQKSSSKESPLETVIQAIICIQTTTEALARNGLIETTPEQRTLLNQLKLAQFEPAQQDLLVKMVCTLNVEKFFTWTRNGGLSLNKDYRLAITGSNRKLDCDDLSPGQLLLVVFDTYFIQEGTKALEHMSNNEQRIKACKFLTAGLLKQARPLFEKLGKPIDWKHPIAKNFCKFFNHTPKEANLSSSINLTAPHSCAAAFFSHQESNALPTHSSGISLEV
jgi:hypothetical protein